MDICDDTFRAKLFTTLEREKIPGNLIILEITERQNACIGDIKKAMLAYKDSGIRFALDDFGTGYRIDSAFLLPNAHCCLTKIVTLAV
ncbi:EAL domain-containing protein [Salmonella enterica]|nr:EAL domain-containing protein [Salmonella enterica]